MPVSLSIHEQWVVTAPAVAEIQRIAAIADPVLRNLLITQCYYELSIAFTQRAGSSSNWCTFATWASKQAGQTIRKEDLQQTLTALLKEEPDVLQAINLLVAIAKSFGAAQTEEQLQQSTLFVLLAKTADRAATAVGKGNKKVFEEIAFHFARFYATCFSDTVYNQEHVDEFTKGLRDGLPPDGQVYLQKAFNRYYQSFFEDDPQKKTELCFLANLEIGFHEQTRLQPEIAAALNAAFANEEEVQQMVHQHLFSQNSFLAKLRLWIQRIFGRTRILDNTIASFTQLLKQQVRKILTDHIMTLTLPPENRLRLGKDLESDYPLCLQELHNQDLLLLLKEIDPTPNSLLQSGATDWANLPERMHFIAELFRCYHEKTQLLSEAFTPGQVAEMKAGRIPKGKL